MAFLKDALKLTAALVLLYGPVLGVSYVQRQNEVPPPPRADPEFCYDGRDIAHSSLCKNMHGRRWAA